MCRGGMVSRSLLVLILQSLAVIPSLAFLTSNRISRSHLVPSPTFVRKKTGGSTDRALGSKKSVYDDTSYGTFEEGDVGISRNSSSRIGRPGDDSQSFFSLYYRIYNKKQDGKDSASGANKLPLVVLHGGPSLPSQYLYPLVPHLSEDRPIIFYDQLGCGKSDEPRNQGFYSLQQSVNDLDMVLLTLGFNKDSRVHLFGHSYGGDLAYEFAKAKPQLVQSLLLSNTPTSMKQAGDAYDQLAAQNPVGFWKQRVCSVDSPALDNALQHVGSVWAGMDVVLDYVATPPQSDIDAGASFPRWTLVVSCARDFAVESSQGWDELLKGLDGAEVESVQMENCAHYPHLEEGASYGSILESFMCKHEDDARR